MIPRTIHEGITSSSSSYNFSSTIPIATAATAASSSMFGYPNALSSKRSLEDAFGTESESQSSNSDSLTFCTISSSSSSSSENEIITPPNSTLRKIGKKRCTTRLTKPNIIVIDSNNTTTTTTTKEPLTPEKSSPLSNNTNSTVTTLLTRKQQQQQQQQQHKSEGTRSTSNLSIDEIVDFLKRRKANNGIDKKPPYSYAVLICLAILQSPEGKLTLSQIYNWISTHFPFYKPRDASWQNSIRHNLSLNEAFIKTQKSLDGKGHFWEVKESSATKFFRSDEGGYGSIRQKLKNLEDYFNVVTTGTSASTSSNSCSESSASSNFSTQTLDGAVSTSTDVGSFGFSTEQSHLEPPHRFSFPRRPDFSTQQLANSLSPIRGPQSASGNNASSFPILPPPLGSSPSKLSFTMYGSNPTLLRSPQNTYKRYGNCFGSNFGEVSPFSSGRDSNSLLLPLPQQQQQQVSSITFSPTSGSPNGTNSTNGGSSLYNPSGANKLPLLIPPTQQQLQQRQRQQFDPLKTPELLMNHSFDRSPCRFVISPGDNDTISKRWQTPSHLFEDIYTSPIFRAMGRSSKVVATPNGSTIIKKGSPVKQGTKATAETPMRSKLSCSGLFGVDVVSVWKRALETMGKDKENEEDKENENVKDKVADVEKSSSEGTKPSDDDSKLIARTEHKPSQFDLKLDKPFQIRHHSS